MGLSSEMSKYKITMTEYLKGRQLNSPLTYEMYDNMCKLLVAVNMLRDKYGKPLGVSSGYRSKEDNRRVAGSPNSLHMTCEAVDFMDHDKSLKKFLLANIQLLEDLDLYAEDFDATPTWVHLQIKAPKSGVRVFRP